MKKTFCTVLATMLAVGAFAQEIKVKNGEIKLDDKVVAYVEGKKQTFDVLSLDKQYTVSGLNFL